MVGIRAASHGFKRRAATRIFDNTPIRGINPTATIISSLRDEESQIMPMDLTEALILAGAGSSPNPKSKHVTVFEKPITWFGSGFAGFGFFSWWGG